METRTEPMHAAVTREDVETFLRTTSFTGYQSVPLPYGLSIPGADLEARADLILGDRVRGRSMLEVGTYYGFFPNAALRRGATRAVGLEPDPGRAAVAAAAARLNGGSYSIVEGTLDTFDPGERFDVVLFLRVLHHVADPVHVVRQLARLCNELLILEFALVDDVQYIRDVVAGGDREPTRLDILRAALKARALRWLAGDLPLCAVGNRPYHRAFYFSRGAFENLFVKHLGVFEHVEFLPGSSDDRRHTLALCRPARAPRGL